tara:strand:- start:307 stop:1074 length:768 start_codon:yes stop_codon:yes gene_type:complete
MRSTRGDLWNAEKTHMKRVFVQQQWGQWLNDNCYSSWYGFSRMGCEVIPFDIEGIEDIALTKETVVHGGIKGVRKCFDILNVLQPPIHNPQDYLPEYCDRNFRTSTLGEVNTNSVGSYPYFIKPLSDHKLFTGFVLNNDMDKLKLYGLPPETPILVSDYINMVSEYRCFIHKGKLVGSKNYTGDFTKNIDYDIVNNAINDYKEQPIGYSLDFALTDNGETTLIEINDGFALGSYGLNPIVYCKIIMDRWNEIVKT